MTYTPAVTGPGWCVYTVNMPCCMQGQHAWSAAQCLVCQPSAWTGVESEHSEGSRSLGSTVARLPIKLPAGAASTAQPPAPGSLASTPSQVGPLTIPDLAESCCTCEVSGDNVHAASLLRHVHDSSCFAWTGMQALQPCRSARDLGPMARGHLREGPLRHERPPSQGTLACRLAMSMPREILKHL